MSLINIDSKYKLVKSWNLTHQKKTLIYYPKKKEQFKQLIKHFNKSDIKFSIKSGECSYDGKSINSRNSNVTVSLKNFNKIININKKNNTVNVQAGAKIKDISLILKKINYTISAIPGGEHITIGGAVSANVIGKDSNKIIGAFGDNVKSITVMMHNGNIGHYKKNSKIFKSFIGSFGLFGIILEVELILKKIKSQNLLLSTFAIGKYSEIKKFLNKKTEFKYMQIDPFFRENTLGIVFTANFSENKANLYKSINFEVNLIDILIFKFSSLFLNLFSWKIFYKFFIFFNRNINKELDIHNFFYSSKYKHLVPYLCKNGLTDYEILLKYNKLMKVLSKIKKLILENRLYPIYVIIKKLHKSKNKYFI